MKKNHRILLFLALMLVNLSCSTSTKSNPAAPASPSVRTFGMGFSPWPWDATIEAVDWTYQALSSDGDWISQHIEEGVPWQEALNESDFPTGYQTALNERKAKSVGKKILLQINSLDMNRSALSPFRTNSVNVALTAPWSTYHFNDPTVKTAYSNYAKRMTDFFSPEIVLTGIELNILRTKTNASQWAELVELQCFLYQDLKSRGVTAPIGVSLITPAFYKPQLYSTEHDYNAQIQVLRDLEPCVDIVAWSVHPFMSGLLADSFPDDYFETIFSLTQKTQAISESSYPAQVWSSSGLTWNGSQEKQNQFIEQMLTGAQSHSLKVVIWYTVRDYDQLWARPVNDGGLGSDSLSLIWRDTGLYDESGNPRSGLTTWKEWLQK